MGLTELPRYKKAELTQKISICVTSEMKASLLKLKASGIDYASWIRILIEEGLREIKK